MTTTRLPGNGDKAPIFIPGGDAAVLCLHGFTGTPYEVAPLARALGSAGFTVSAPLLAGHGQDARALANTHWQDWLASAEQALDGLRAATNGARVAIVGFSMGGLLALRLARLRPGCVSALAVLSAPLRLPGWQIAVARAWMRLPAFLRQGRLATVRKRGGSDVTDDNVRSENPSLAEMPMAGIVDLVALGELVRHELGHIHAPVLVAHGERDRTVPLRASYELVGSIGSDVVERVWLPRSGHLIGVDVERTQLCEALVRFIAKHHSTSTSIKAASNDGHVA